MAVDGEIHKTHGRRPLANISEKFLHWKNFFAVFLLIFKLLFTKFLFNLFNK